MGHVRNYTMGDVLARFRRMQGFEVLHPMGWDAFGMPAENAAMEKKVHPGTWTRANIAAMRGQLKRIGFALDWSRELATCEPDYYGHEQALFLDLMEAGLVFRKESEVNWDPVDMTVLANEQVIDGKGWRSGAPVERKKLNQWFLKITDFAEELLDGLGSLDHWPDKVRLMQENWIGKSQGLQFCFRMVGEAPGTPNCDVEVFTTRPDTIFGASFVAISPGHPIAEGLAATDPEGRRASSSNAARAGRRRRRSRPPRSSGCDTGLEVIHPLDPKRKLPVWIANFVLMDYGTGALFGVPAHDVRDYEFATKYKLPIRRVVAADPSGANEPVVEAETERGMAVNSDFLDGLTSDAASAEVIRRAETAGWGQGKTQYRLRDWGVSRQRYWGTPIPIIHCDALRPGRRPARPIAGGAARGCQLRTARQPARPARWLAAGPLPQLRRPGAARDGHARHVRRIPAGTSSALPASPRTSRSTAPRPRPGFRSGNISAGSSMRSSTCSTPASGPARSSGSARSALPSRSPGCSRKGW